MTQSLSRVVPETKVWVVTASQGEYSDRSEWAVEVHCTEEAGRRAVEAYDATDREETLKLPGHRRWMRDEVTHYLSEVPFISAAPAPAPDPDTLSEAVGLLRDLVGVCEPNIYPQPDKPESSWAKLQAAKAFLDANTPDPTNAGGEK